MKHACILLLLLFPGILLARPKTDSVVLVNGNVITCEILSMSRAYLSLSTDSMGTIEVKWPDVKRLTSEHGFVVEDSQGTLYYGLLSSDADGILQISDSVRGTHRVEMTSVVSIYPSSRTVWRRFDGWLDAGFSYTKSSSRSDFNLSGVLRYQSLKWIAQLSADSLISVSGGSTETDRDTVSLTGLRHLGSRWDAFSMYGYQHNLELGLTYRNSILGGISKRLVQTDRMVFTVLGGVALSREEYTDTTAENNGEGGLGLRYQFYKLYSPKLDISTQWIVSPSFTVSDRVRSEFEIRSKIELIKDFFWSLSVYDSYDSKPPGETEQKQDYGVTTGIGWTFG